VIDAFLQLMLEALAVDFAAAGPEMAERARRDSHVAQLTRLVHEIPHPTLDAAIVRHQLEWVRDLFGVEPDEDDDAEPP
jgi:hypothetical protein